MRKSGYRPNRPEFKLRKSIDLILHNLESKGVDLLSQEGDKNPGLTYEKVAECFEEAGLIKVLIKNNEHEELHKELDSTTHKFETSNVNLLDPRANKGSIPNVDRVLECFEELGSL